MDEISVPSLVDDATVIALVVRVFQSEIDTYKEWKKNN